jgi:hypothetical protein
MRRSAVGALGLLGLIGALVLGGTASGGQGSPNAPETALQTPRQTCDRPQPTSFRKVKRWGCFSISATISWQARLEAAPGAACRGTVQFDSRWSGRAGTYWIGDDMTIQRAWNGAPARWAPRDVIMVGPATFDVRFTGRVPQGSTCAPAEAVNPGCGKRTMKDYAVGIVNAARSEYDWIPDDYTPTQRPPDYSTCGAPGLRLSAVMPPWIRMVRGFNEGFGGPVRFELASVPPDPRADVTRARATRAAAERLLSKPVGTVLVLRARTRPDPGLGTGRGSFEGTWTGTITATRIK